VEDEGDGFSGNLHRDGSVVAEPVEDGEQLVHDQPVTRPLVIWMKKLMEDFNKVRK
jgi:hypothetical protein